MYQYCQVNLMKYILLTGIILVLISCSNKASAPDTKTKNPEPEQYETLEIPDTGIKLQPKTTVKLNIQSEPDAELEYFDEHFDDYFDDPEDGITYPDDIFDFYLD